MEEEETKEEVQEKAKEELTIAFESDSSSILSKLKDVRYNSDISILRFHEIEIGGEVFAAVTHLLKSGRKWDHVEFVDCENPTIVAMIISITMIVTNVKSLKYGSYCLPNNILLALSAALQANAPTQSLQLDTCITIQAATSISMGLSDNTQIWTLDLTGCDFAGSIDTMEALCNGLAKNSTIRTLKLSGCGLDDQLVAIFIRHGMKNHSAISELWLDGNYCRNVALEALGEMLEVETTKLSVLSLNSQGFESGDEQFDMASIAKALEKNATLNHLDLSNDCTILGTAKLLDPLILSKILKSNKSLSVLDLSNNCLDDKDLNLIIEGLEVNETLEAIQLGSNNITELGLTDFLDRVDDMKGLKRVGFSGNLFEEPGIRILYESFPVSISTDF